MYKYSDFENFWYSGMFVILLPCLTAVRIVFNTSSSMLSVNGERKVISFSLLSFYHCLTHDAARFIKHVVDDCSSSRSQKFVRLAEMSVLCRQDPKTKCKSLPHTIHPDKAVAVLECGPTRNTYLPERVISLLGIPTWLSFWQLFTVK